VYVFRVSSKRKLLPVEAFSFKLKGRSQVVALCLWRCSSVCGVGVASGLARVLFFTDRRLLPVPRQ